MTSLMRAYFNPVSLGLGVVVVMLLVAGGLLTRRPRRPGPLVSVVAGSAMFVWLLLVVYVTIVPQLTSMLPVRFSLLPLVDTVQGLLSSNAENVAAATLANVALFLPLGVALAVMTAPDLTGRLWLRPLLAGLAVSIAVELTQGVVLQKGAMTADDLIANTAGALLGWWLARRVGRTARAAHPAPVITGQPKP